MSGEEAFKEISINKNSNKYSGLIQLTFQKGFISIGNRRVRSDFLSIILRANGQGMPDA